MRPRRVPAVTAAIVVAIGTLVITGWALNVSVLRGPIPGLIEMKANTAVGFILLGCGLWATQSQRRALQVAGLVGAAVAGAIGAATLVQYIAGIEGGIDELLFEDKPGASQTVHPGRLAPQTAVNFVLAWLALTILHRPSRRPLWAVHSAAAGIIVISLFALIGYAYGANALGTVPALSPIAVHTALACLVLGAGILWVSPPSTMTAVVSGNAAGSRMARRLLPVAVILLPGLGWLRLAGQRAGFYDERTGVALTIMAFLIIFSLGILAIARLLDRAEKERRSAAFEQERLAAIVGSSGDAIFSTTPEGEITSWNAGAEQLYGYSRNEAVGQSARILVPADRGDERAAVLGRVLRGERVDQFETERVAKGGSAVPVSLTISPIRDTTGAVVGASSIARDISEQRRTQEALARTTEEAERANRAKSEFHSRMSHELRTPLNAILGFGQLLELDRIDEEQRENVEQILKGGRHLLQLIDEVLDISRIETGTFSISTESVHLPTLLADVRALLSPLAAERGIRLDLELPDPDRYVVADLQRVKQVLLNLVSNAIKYNRDGGSARLAVQEVEPGRIRILVSDTGPGIPADKLERVFVAFDRIGAEESATQGTGLGLALARSLIEAMGGTVHVESEVGVGSTFSVELSAGEPVDEPRVEIPQAPIKASGSQPTVLYIEDNPSNFKLVDRFLGSRLGATLIAAAHGTLGIELARQHLPDLILLDLHLPDIPGMEVLSRLKADPITRHIPVAVISADATHGRAARVRAAGAFGYLSKPLDLKEFRELVDLAVGEPEVVGHD